MNLRAEDCQNKCAPWQVAIHSTRSVRANKCSGFGVAGSTGSMSFWARQDSDDDESTNKQDVEDHEHDSSHLEAACSDTKL